jgi:hypothetical protein
MSDELDELVLAINQETALTDFEMDTIENCAQVVIEAVRAGDFDSAYIAATTSLNPAMLAMFIAQVAADATD